MVKLAASYEQPRPGSIGPLLTPHRYPGPPMEAILLERENRFLARCELADGAVVHAHVPDRGRLLGLLVPGARVWLFRAANTARRTAWSLLVAEEPASRVLVATDPAIANDRVLPLIEQGRIPALGGGWQVRREATLGHSRIDFLLTRGNTKLALEVKSVGVVRDGTALFPDAPTSRAVRHLAELEALVRAGHQALLLFVAQRGDARAVAADEQIDPEFAAALARSSRYVKLAAVCFDIRPDGGLFLGKIPVTCPTLP